MMNMSDEDYCISQEGQHSADYTSSTNNHPSQSPPIVSRFGPPEVDTSVFNTFNALSRWKNAKRIAIVDGCNMLFATKLLNKNNKPADALGILQIVHKLLASDYDVLVVIFQASYIDGEKRNLVNNAIILDELLKMGLILKVPYSYDDDLVILETARILGGFVISNDVYRDHLQPNLQEVIKNRVIQCRFEQTSPLNGPNPDVRTIYNLGFEMVLHKNPTALIAMPEDSDYDMVLRQRTLRNQLKINETIDQLEVLADYAFIKNGQGRNLPYYYYDNSLQKWAGNSFSEMFTIWKKNNAPRMFGSVEGQ